MNNHAKPMGANLKTPIGSAGFAAAVAAAVGMAAFAFTKLPSLPVKLGGLLRYRDQIATAGEVLVTVVVVLLLLEQVRRFGAKPPVPWHIRANRAVLYGIATTGGLLLTATAKNPDLWATLQGDEVAQTTWVAVGIASVLGIYFVALHPFEWFGRGDKLLPFQVQVERLRNSYDYILGVCHEGDWEQAQSGQRAWLQWPEEGTYGNLLSVGQIGSGKTSQVADPLVHQVLGKFPGNLDKQPSLVVLDLKGNQCTRYWEWAKAFGRQDQFWVVRPDLVGGIPEDRFVSFNVLSGWDDPDLLGIELQEALESTKERPSPDYFQNVQKEFLIHTQRVLKAVKPDGPDLKDVQAFVSSGENRNALTNGAVAPGEGDGDLAFDEARAYFRDEFGRLSPQEQASLLRGLASQLTMVTNRAVTDAFCHGSGTGCRRVFEGWPAEVMDRPGIIVFSCPPSKYTDGLSRLLGILFLKSFQQAMLTRCDAAFRGNKQRPVMLLVDEAHAFLNKKLGDFMSVSRECKVCTLLLTQSISQIQPYYRGIVQSNTRTRLVLSVSDETAREFSDILGETTEVQESLSVGESLQGVRENPYLEVHSGRSRGLSQSRSYHEKERKRFAAHALQHLPQFRAVAHLFDGKAQADSQMVETIPWYRLPYHLLDPLEHPAILCQEGGRHEYGRRAQSLRCKRCGHELSKNWEVEDFLAFNRQVKRIAALSPQGRAA